MSRVIPLKSWCPQLIAGVGLWMILIFIAGCGGPEPLRFSIQFEDAGELREGSPVMLRDMEIGRVASIERSSGVAVVRVEIEPGHREALYREAIFSVSRDSGRPCIKVQDRPGERTAIRGDEVIDARPGWFERLSRGLDELGSSAQKALEQAKTGLQDAVTAFEDSEEFKTFKERLTEAGRDAATLARSRYARFVREDLPKLEAKAKDYRDHLEREGRTTEAEIFWKWFSRWADAVRNSAPEPEEASPKPEKEP